MIKRYGHIILVILVCLFITGCSDIKVIKGKQKTEKEVVKYVDKLLKDKYGKIDVELDEVNEAYTFDGDLIDKANEYVFEITDKEGNKGYAKYIDAFKIEDEEFDVIFSESYNAIYNNNELKYYDYLVGTYFDEEDIIDRYYISDYDDLDLLSKARVVYVVNLNSKKLSAEDYAKFIKLGYDLRKYRLYTYGVINYDDPEVSFIFKNSEEYFNPTFYGLMDSNNEEVIHKFKIEEKFLDIHNLRSYINFNVSDEEYLKMNYAFNSIGTYFVDNIHNVISRFDEKNGYLLINNITKNGYRMNVLFKFKFDSKTNSYLYESFNILDSDSKDNFDGSILKTW